MSKMLVVSRQRFLPERLLEETIAVNSLSREIFGGKARVGYGILRKG